MSAEIISQNDWFNWSLNQLSREFNIARETVQRRLRTADIKPSGERRGHPVYSVCDAARAILITDNSSAGLNDPDEMSPKERSDWYKSENERLKFERESSVSVDADECRVQMAEIAKMGLQVLETLPDILERDYQLDPTIISNVESRIDSLREQWANTLEDVA